MSRTSGGKLRANLFGSRGRKPPLTLKHTNQGFFRGTREPHLGARHRVITAGRTAPR